MRLSHSQLACEENDSASAVAARKLTHFFDFVKPTIADHWRCHSIALGYLESLGTCDSVPDDVSCGPTAFAAIAGITITEAASFFPFDTPWTNRSRMEQALKAFGWRFTKLNETWPRLGLCLIHWRGPWTDRGYAHSILQRTHWVAVIGDYVFDVNWRGWLPKENWEDAVVAELLLNSASRDWVPLTAYEIMLG